MLFFLLNWWVQMQDSPATPIRQFNPSDLGPPRGYSQVVEVQADRIIFIAGQTALGKNGELIGAGDFAVQVDQVFRNLARLLFDCESTGGPRGYLD